MPMFQYRNQHNDAFGTPRYVEAVVVPNIAARTRGDIHATPLLPKIVLGAVYLPVTEV